MSSSNFGFVGPRFELEGISVLYGNPEVADGRPQKYFWSENCWPMKREPIISPFVVIKLPFACSSKRSCDKKVITDVYIIPVNTVKNINIRKDVVNVGGA